MHDWCWRIGILDVDYHAGDGTLRCFRSMGSSLCAAFVSIHAKQDYPHVYGFGENGIEFPTGATWENGYSQVLKEALDRLQAHSLDILVISSSIEFIPGNVRIGGVAGTGYPSR